MDEMKHNQFARIRSGQDMRATHEENEYLRAQLNRAMELLAEKIALQPPPAIVLSGDESLKVLNEQRLKESNALRAEIENMTYDLNEYQKYADDLSRALADLRDSGALEVTDEILGEVVGSPEGVVIYAKQQLLELRAENAALRAQLADALGAELRDDAGMPVDREGK